MTEGNVMQINCNIHEKPFSKALLQAFRGQNSELCTFENSGDVAAYAEPFPHCIIKNFIDDNSRVKELEDHLYQLEYYDKDNDLYKFRQTRALEYHTDPLLSSVRVALTSLKERLSNIFELKLTEKIDMFSAQYRYTDYLLCHDDELEGRRFAYIYYLVDEDWSENDGGALELLSADETGKVDKVYKSIIPKRNSLLFFEVTPKSFHQVAEVLAENKCRLSLTGWFHGISVPRCDRIVEAPVSFCGPKDIDEETFLSLITEEYLNPVTQSDIQDRFEEESEIQLSNFLLEEKYDQLNKDIRSSEIVWKLVGPPNKRCFEIADENSLPESLKECIAFLTSDAMFLILSNMTGLKLHPLAANSEDESESEDQNEEPDAKRVRSSDEGGRSGSVSYAVRRWGHRSYTLLHDNDVDQGKDFALDAVLQFNTDEWDCDYGGFTLYVAKDEDEELIRIEPKRNCLSVVYRDPSSLRFVKYMTHKVNKMAHPYVYDICLVYQEP